MTEIHNSNNCGKCQNIITEMNKDISEQLLRLLISNHLPDCFIIFKNKTVNILDIYTHEQLSANLKKCSSTKIRKCFLCGFKKKCTFTYTDYFIGGSCSERLELLFQLSNQIRIFIDDKNQENQNLVLSLINQMIKYGYIHDKTNSLICETHKLCVEKKKITKLCELIGTNYQVHKYTGTKRKRINING